MRNHHNPDNQRNLMADLADAETDLTMLIHYVRSALPTLLYVIEDAKDWRRDARETIHKNLLTAVENAERRQIKRRNHIEEK